MNGIFGMKNKVVVLIGGTGLIGTALAKGFSDAGAIVCTASRHQNVTAHPNTSWKYVDITCADSINAYVNSIDSEYKRIDVWINCAWPRTGTSGPIENVSIDSVEKDTSAHLLGFYSCCKSALCYMKKYNKGSIINFGSIYGELSPDFRIYEKTEIYSSPSYALIKGGIHAFTKYLACEAAAFNIRVNAICPGGVLNNHSALFDKQYSSRIPLRRMAKPEELVGPAIFLASDSSSYVIGQLLFVDGGLTAW